MALSRLSRTHQWNILFQSLNITDFFMNRPIMITILVFRRSNFVIYSIFSLNKVLHFLILFLYLILYYLFKKYLIKLQILFFFFNFFFRIVSKRVEIYIFLQINISIFTLNHLLKPLRSINKNNFTKINGNTVIIMQMN